MILPPSFIKLRFGRGRCGIWLPVVLLWPIAAMLVVLVAPFVVILEIFMKLSGNHFPLCRMALAGWRVMAAARGTVVRVDAKKNNAVIDIKIL
jgi:hypothetical protein